MAPEDAKPDNGKGYFSTEEIWSADDTAYEDFAVEEWGGKKLKLRSITKGEQQEMRRKAQTKSGDIDADVFDLLLLKHGVVVPELTPEDVRKLKEKRSGVVEKIIGKILELSDMREGADSAADKAFRD